MNPNPYDSYAELLLKTGRFDEAIAQYRKALSIDSKFISSFNGIAAALMYEGKHDDALTEIQKATTQHGTKANSEPHCSPEPSFMSIRENPTLGLQEMGKQYAIAENPMMWHPWQMT